MWGTEQRNSTHVIYTSVSNTCCALAPSKYRGCYSLVRTFLAFPAKGPGTPARKDAVSIRSQQKAPVWKLKLGGERERERERKEWRCSLMLSFWSLLTFQVSEPMNALGLIMGMWEAECAP